MRGWRDVAAILLVLTAGLAWGLEPPTYGGAPEVADGDDLVFRYAEHPAAVRVRIAGVQAPSLDATCPESARAGGTRRVACGRMAREALAAHLVGRLVLCRHVALAAPARAFGVCRVASSPRPDAPSSDVGAWLVSQGWAKAWPRDDSNRRYLDLERGARQQRRGLWRWVFPDPWEAP